mgnify:CR=1 FL=1
MPLHVALRDARPQAEFVARMPADVADRLRAQGVDPAEMISTDAMSEADRYSVAFLKDGTIKLTDLAPEDESGGEDEATAPAGWCTVIGATVLGVATDTPRRFRGPRRARIRGAAPIPLWRWRTAHPTDRKSVV